MRVNSFGHQIQSPSTHCNYFMSRILKTPAAIVPRFAPKSTRIMMLYPKQLRFVSTILRARSEPVQLNDLLVPALMLSMFRLRMASVDSSLYRQPWPELYSSCRHSDSLPCEVLRLRICDIICVPAPLIRSIHIIMTIVRTPIHLCQSVFHTLPKHCR